MEWNKYPVDLVTRNNAYLPKWMTRRTSIPHHQVGRAVPTLCSGHIKFEHGYPNFISGTGHGFAVDFRISGSRQSGGCGLQMIPACCVFWQWVIRRMQPSAASVPYPKLAPFVFCILDRFAFYKMHLKPYY